MPTLAERIQAALERHTAEVASILASASMAEVIAFTQSKGAVASPWAAVPPEPAGPPDDTAPRPAQPPKWAVRRAEDERLTLSVLKFLAKNGGSSPVSRVAKELCPKNMGVRDFSRRVTTFRKHKGEVICRTRAGIFIVFDLTDAGKQWLSELGITIEQPKADTVSTTKDEDAGVMRERMKKINEWLKDHPWSTRAQICNGVGVTYAQLSALDRGDKSASIAREWTGSLDVKKVRSTSGHLVKVYAVRGAEDDVGHGSQGVLRDRGSTYDQIAEGIGTSRRDLLNAINVVIPNRDKWKERVEVFGKDKRWMGVARTYRVKA
jgi:hypothetical protein